MVELHPGQLARHPKILSVRPLAREDLVRLREKRVGPRIKKLRRIHHTVAKLLASGMADEDILRLTGYSPTRLATLKVDPSVQDLVAGYHEEANAPYVEAEREIRDEMIAINKRTLGLVQDYLDEIEDSDDRVPIKSILPIVTEMADRTGHGKHSSTTNVQVNFAQMMKENAQRRGRSNVIDAKVLPGPLAPTPAQIASTPSESVPAPQAPKPVVSFRRRV